MRREQVTGFQLDDRKIRKNVPESISFFNNKGQCILSIDILKHSKSVMIHPYGANISMFDNNEFPMFKVICGDNGETRAVTTNKIFNNGERVFDQEKEE